MKPPYLFLLALTLSGAAWISLPATSSPPAEIAVIEDVPLPALHTSAVRKKQNSNHTPAAPVSLPPTPLEQALSAGDVCETARLLSPMGSTAPMYEAFLNSTSPSAELKESFGPDGPLLSLNPAAKKYKSIAAQTLQALRLAGSVDSPVSAPTDFAAARALLLELEKKEPGNGFYPLFRVLVESRLNYTKHALKETAARIIAATSFESHVGELDREMREAAFQNPALLYELAYFKPQDSVNYYNAMSEVRGLEKFDATPVARLMTEEGLRSGSPPWLGEFEQSRYNAGRMLDEEHYPSSSALDKDRTLDHQPFPPSVNSYGPQVCDPGPYERYFVQAREAR